MVHEGLLLEPGYAYNVVPHAHRHAREGKFILRLFAKQVRRAVGRWSCQPTGPRARQESGHAGLCVVMAGLGGC